MKEVNSKLDWPSGASAPDFFKKKNSNNCKKGSKFLNFVGNKHDQVLYSCKNQQYIQVTIHTFRP